MTLDDRRVPAGEASLIDARRDRREGSMLGESLRAPTAVALGILASPAPRFGEGLLLILACPGDPVDTLDARSRRTARCSSAGDTCAAPAANAAAEESPVEVPDRGLSSPSPGGALLPFLMGAACSLAASRGLQV